MFCQAGFDQWLTTIMQHLSHLSKPQATVLALWSFGMVLARSCALTAVSHLLATGMQRKEQTVRQQLREWYYDVPAQAGHQAPSAARRDLLCAPAGLGGERVAGHPTGAGHRCHDLGATLCGAGRQRGVSRLCHPRGLGDPARGRQTRLAAGVAAAVAAAAPSDSPGLDGDRVGRSGLVCALAVSAHHAPGLASVFADQHGGQLSARRGDLLAALDDLGPTARARVGVARASPLRATRSPAPCWPAGRTATRTRG